MKDGTLSCPISHALFQVQVSVLGMPSFPLLAFFEFHGAVFVFPVRLNRPILHVSFLPSEEVKYDYTLSINKHTISTTSSVDMSCHAALKDNTERKCHSNNIVKNWSYRSWDCLESSVGVYDI